MSVESTVDGRVENADTTNATIECQLLTIADSNLVMQQMGDHIMLIDIKVNNLAGRHTDLCHMLSSCEKRHDSELHSARAAINRLIKRVDKIESREMEPLYDHDKHHHNMGWSEFVRMVDRAAPGRDWQISKVRGGVYRYCLRLLPVEGKHPVDIFGDELFDLAEQLYDKD